MNGSENRSHVDLEGEKVYAQDKLLVGHIKEAVRDFNTGLIAFVSVQLLNSNQVVTVPWKSCKKDADGLLVCIDKSVIASSIKSECDKNTGDDFLGNLPKHHNLDPFWERYPSL